MEGLIVGLAGVLIWTSEQRFPAMREFYVETLGLRPRSDRTHFVNFQLANLQLGAARLTVAVHEKVEGISKDPLRTMVNLAVVDIDLAHQRLLAAGVPCLRAPSEEHWGGRVATYSDPDGNTIQLMTGTSD